MRWSQAPCIYLTADTVVLGGLIFGASFDFGEDKKKDKNFTNLEEIL